MKGLRDILIPGTDRVYFGVSAEIHKKLFNHGIEWVTGVDYTHGLAVFWSEAAKDFVVTNSHGVGVQFDSLDQFIAGSIFKRLFEVKVTPEKRLSFITEAIRLDGTPYSKQNIGGILLAKILHAKFNPFADKDKALFCSEYTCNLAKAIGLRTAYEILDIGRELVEPPHMVKAFEILSQTRPNVVEIQLPKDS